MKSGIRSISVFSPAKVNLFLAVTGKRSDGFHDILSVAAPLLFGDVVTIEARAGNGEIDCLCPGLRLPAGEENLVARAARAWLGMARREWRVCITISKRIPGLVCYIAQADGHQSLHQTGQREGKLINLI